MPQFGYARGVAYFGRSLWSCISLAAIAWGGFVLPVLWQQAPVIAGAKHIIAGDNFKREALDQIESTAGDFSESKWSRPAALASIAIVDLRLLEQAVGDADQRRLDGRQEELKVATQKALANVPADPYLWLVLFWVKNARDGFRADHLKYLSMSYALGPNEGWMAARRNRLALALFAGLTPDLQNNAISEFARLVDSGFVPEAADILTGPGWPVRDRLLAALANADEVYREQFARTVYRLGYDVSVPGVKPFGFRPWR